MQLHRLHQCSYAALLRTHGEPERFTACWTNEHGEPMENQSEHCMLNERTRRTNGEPEQHCMLNRRTLRTNGDSERITKHDESTNTENQEQDGCPERVQLYSYSLLIGQSVGTWTVEFEDILRLLSDCYRRLNMNILPTDQWWVDSVPGQNILSYKTNIRLKN